MNKEELLAEIDAVWTDIRIIKHFSGYDTNVIARSTAAGWKFCGCNDTGVAESI